MQASGDHIALRNSNNHSQGILFLTKPQAASLLTNVKAGTLDNVTASTETP